MSYVPTPPPWIYNTPLPKKVDMQAVHELRAEVVGVARSIACALDGQTELIELAPMREALRDVLTRLDDAQRRYLVICEPPAPKESE